MPDSAPRGFAPVATEARVAVEVEHAGGASVVSGVVDRVDVAAGGDGYVVYDYKSGRRMPEVRDVLDGLGFQLPVYLVAAAGLAGGARPLGAAYYPLSDPADVRPRWFGERGAVPADVRQRAGLIAGLEDVLARVPLAVGAALDAMGRGLFHPGALPPERKGCRHCDFRRICRVDDARMRAALEGGAGGLYRPLPLLPEPRHAAPA